ncbi:MAG TPA: ABC transporter permease [Chloroflexota bacterium]|jgi:ABC-type nitrate/sulfonate/bicarbonate transport system permease component|nr:ABC transporter permease [Chloroflexota bacterium]
MQRGALPAGVAEGGVDARRAWAAPWAPAALGLALRRQALGLATLAALLVVWEAASRTRLLNPQLVPPVTDILATFGQLWTDRPFPQQTFVTQTVATLWRMAVGYVAAAVLGIGLGLLMGRSRAVADLFWPLIEFLRPTPPVALIPVLLLLVGIGDQMRLIIIAFAALFPILLNTIDGVRGVHPTLLDVARTFRFRGLALLRRVIFPAALPQIVAGLRISLAIALIVALVSEMVGATNGLGYFILQQQRGLRIRETYAAMVQLALVGLVLNALFVAVERRVLAWHRQSTGQA